MSSLVLAIVLTVTARISWYDPSLCPTQPINCFNPDRWWHTASQEDARSWYGRGLACPISYPFGTRFIIENSWRGGSDGVWVCVDRGNAVITHDDGTVQLDLLLDYPVWADVIPVTVIIKADKTERLRVKPVGHCNRFEWRCR